MIYEEDKFMRFIVFLKPLYQLQLGL
ncbi:Predicted protein [Streptococcus thermophilus LMD-9]|nr:Predicted protein [Streptococcus thermophilus LMD-9]